MSINSVLTMVQLPRYIAIGHLIFTGIHILLAMSAWTNVVKNKGKQKVQQKCSQSVLLSKSDWDGVKLFLSVFKTSPCTKLEFHDHRKCDYYHSEKDRRRNPYTNIYLPDEEDILSNVEYVYHPLNFLTRICEHPSACPYGRYCSRAHEKGLVRNADVAKQEYNEHMRNVALERKMHSKPSLGAYAPTLQKDLSTTASITHGFTHGSPRWNVGEDYLPKCSEYLFELPLDSRPWFLVNASENFFSFLREMAMKEGLAQIEIRNNPWGEGEYGIAVRGSRDARESAVGQLATYLFDPPSNFFVQQSKSLSRRVVEKLSGKTQSEINDMILGKKFAKCAFVEFSDDEIIICACDQPRCGAAQMISQVFDKLSFWMKQEGHDKFVDCICCMDSFNLDEGVVCREGHFYCGGKSGCIGVMVKEQLQRIQHQDNAITCSICQETIDTRSLAPHLSEEAWLALEEAMIDSKVNLRVERLSHEFDKRLNAKIQEFMNEYGSLSGLVKSQAKQLAKEAQDDIMNLKCPHCKAPYAEFDGCMAIQCGTCKKFFCGYCHHGTDTGSGAHDHVRQCLSNETNNGSYYATREQIKIAQRKHRTRMLSLSPAPTFFG
jgi:hypothetical protein